MVLLLWLPVPSAAAVVMVAVAVAVMFMVGLRIRVGGVVVLQQARQHAAVAGGHVVVAAQLLRLFAHPRNHHVDHLAGMFEQGIARGKRREEYSALLVT